MSAQQSDAIVYLKASIARYNEQMAELQRRLAEGAGSLAERAQMKMQQEQIAALMEDATRLLTQISL